MGCEYVVVGALGITYKNEGPNFSNLNPKLGSDFTIIGHLLDKKDQFMNYTIKHLL